MAKVKVGIIGTGFSAQSHLEALNRVPFVEVYAVASRSQDKAQAFADKFGVTKAYGSYEELLQDPAVDAVHNCTPNYLHHPINIAVLKAGKHLLSEKPLAMSSEESKELAALAAKNDVVSGVCFNYRHYPMVQEARQAIREGKIGKVHLVTGGYLQDWLLFPTDYSWRLEPDKNGDSRAIADIGSHWCDTVQHVLGQNIVEVFADLKTVHPVRQKPTTAVQSFASNVTAEFEEMEIATEDAGTVLVHFENGAHGVFTVSQVNAGRKNHLHFEIAGNQASLAWEQENPNKLWFGHRDRANQELMRDPGLLSEQARGLAHYPGGHEEGWPDGLKNLFLNFYEAVRLRQKGEDWQSHRTFSSFAEGHRIMQLIDAILESHRTKRWVSIGD
ncbi:Gfo/Idh/MocA family protein [Laceyella putida]|uniref:Gfo/Idh/MocA family protein n=1 Tax=Laceyella putida TaxID=110101 RepID=A0ABW2RI33_9BACL